MDKLVSCVVKEMGEQDSADLRRRAQAELEKPRGDRWMPACQDAGEYNYNYNNM